MSGKKKIRTRGKLQLSRYFQNLEKGQKVAVVREHAVRSNFPSNIQGNTGIVQSKRGRAYVVLIKDHNKLKNYIIQPVHLKKIKTAI